VLDFGLCIASLKYRGAMLLLEEMQRQQQRWETSLMMNTWKNWNYQHWFYDNKELICLWHIRPPPPNSFVNLPKCWHWQEGIFKEAIQATCLNSTIYNSLSTQWWSFQEVIRCQMELCSLKVPVGCIWCLIIHIIKYGASCRSTCILIYNYSLLIN
jgi:hypothetical protein